MVTAKHDVAMGQTKTVVNKKQAKMYILIYSAMKPNGANANVRHVDKKMPGRNLIVGASRVAFSSR